MRRLTQHYRALLAGEKMPGQRILIVDDNQSLHEDFKKILKIKDDGPKARLMASRQSLFGATEAAPKVSPEFVLDFAFQGEEAYAKAIAAQSEGKAYAVIFVDVRMPPGWDGITTIARIREKVPETEFVICTAYSDYSFDEIVRKLGVSENVLLLKKPFDAVEVQQMALALTAKWHLNQKVKKHTLELEDLVEQRTKELDVERARSVTKAKLIALGEMAGGIAHEINNPLAIIQQYAALLGDMSAEELTKETVSKITANIVATTDRIAKIIKGLRTISRTGENDPFDPATVGQILDESLAISREKFKLRDIKVTVDNPSPFLEIQCRQVQIIQVMANLLNNSYDAVENLQEKWITIEVRETQDFINILVTDSGSGISKEVREKMFYPFFTTKDFGKGTGLGLSVSKGIVEAHNGKLVYDENTKNTRFSMILPKKRIQSVFVEKAS